MITTIENGTVCSPKGFESAGIIAGLKRSGKPDMALIYTKTPATVAAAYTSNKFCAAPVIYDKEITDKKNTVKAIIINSGNANACTGNDGYQNAITMAKVTAQELGINPDEVLVSSTGRIGVPMPMDIILKGIKLACDAKSTEQGINAAKAIITTDTYEKHIAASVKIDNKTITIGGMAKGAGMIAPKLVGPKCTATMLSYITTDANVSQEFLDACLSRSLDESFNRVTVDGDTSTNDTFLFLANGAAGNTQLTAQSEDAELFYQAFIQVVGYLAKHLVLDGEGVTKFVEIEVKGAPNNKDARKVAESIANSALCKTAWFGADPNWGRILCAAGYSGVEFDPYQVNLWYEGLHIVRNGQDAGTPEETQTKALQQREFKIELDLGNGEGTFTIWTCDLTYEYVKINADYHT